MMTMNWHLKTSLKVRSLSTLISYQDKHEDGMGLIRGCHSDKNYASFEGDWMPTGQSWSAIFFKLFPTVWLFDCCMHAMSQVTMENGWRALLEVLSCGFSCQHDVGDQKQNIGTALHTIPTPILSHINSPNSWQRPASTRSLTNFALQERHRHHTKIAFGRSARWWECGTKILLHFFLLGLYALMTACPSGFNNGLAQGGCFVLANCTHLVTNTMLNAAVYLEFCFQWRWLREKLSLLSLESLNWMMSLAEKLVVCCYACLSLKPIFHTGCYIALDNGFCVLKAITALKKGGVLVAALIKKQKASLLVDTCSRSAHPQ